MNRHFCSWLLRIMACFEYRWRNSTTEVVYYRMLVCWRRSHCLVRRWTVCRFSRGWICGGRFSIRFWSRKELKRHLLSFLLIRCHSIITPLLPLSLSLSLLPYGHMFTQPFILQLIVPLLRLFPNPMHLHWVRFHQAEGRVKRLLAFGTHFREFPVRLPYTGIRYFFVLGHTFQNTCTYLGVCRIEGLGSDFGLWHFSQNCVPSPLHFLVNTS